MRGVPGLALLAIALATTSFLIARHWPGSPTDFQRTAAPAGCDLRAGPCTQVIDAGRVSFAISPAAIPLMKTLTLRVETEGFEPTDVAVDIRGLNMDMGLNRTVLQKDEKVAWEGETILPVCSQRRMEWEAAVQLGGHERVEIPFPFATYRP
jgi:hypothetical protein